MPVAIKELTILEPSRIRVVAARLDEIDLEIDGKMIKGVKLKRPFPYSHPEIIIFYQDEKELGILLNYKLLDSKSRELLESVLRVVYFMPVIKKILDISRVRGRYRWKVVTDKGEETFETWSRCVRVLPDGRMIVKDVHGRAYLVDNVEKLDSRSRLLLNMMV